eukprot:TRINITY_DN30791_c0_g1_i1.p3 TRINITY_DN30791_c0_g1~~TRINITY_DN30791_c0_g1_i1.p3  ORF type:complete len:274 (-),score=58.95 TRINITY_DN30791_c0_g1_i1:1030-1851(-)
MTEKKLSKELTEFGPIRRVRIVKDKKDRTRGYAFIEFEHKSDLKVAYKMADGRKIDGKRILVDVERGRTVPGWKPRRLGGGLGGTPKVPAVPDRTREEDRSTRRDDRDRERGDRERERETRDRDRERRERETREQRPRDVGQRDVGRRDRDRGEDFRAMANGAENRDRDRRRRSRSREPVRMEYGRERESNRTNNGYQSRGGGQDRRGDQRYAVEAERVDNKDRERKRNRDYGENEYKEIKRSRRAQSQEQPEEGEVVEPSSRRDRRRERDYL